MEFLLFLIFLAIAAAAVAFVCWPLLRLGEKGRSLLAGSVAALTLAIAAGAYVFVGHPEMALRALEPPKPTDAPALVSKLAWMMRRSPGDPRGWLLLGRSYMDLKDPTDAALAYKRAMDTAPPSVRPLLLPDYGLALTMQAGAVTPDAEAAFRQALAHDPKNAVARFYVGQAYAEHHDKTHALETWKSLLADTPAQAPWRAMLIDRIALLDGTPRAVPPAIQAMVQGLADRLKSHPDDPEGWQRLVKSYAVLGDLEKAQAALADAHMALAGNPAEIASLDQEARDLNLK